jgi:hypothetical protein
MTQANDDRTEGLLAVVSTVLLALATVATAWAGYQASRWHVEQAQSADARDGRAARVGRLRRREQGDRDDVAVFEGELDDRMTFAPVDRRSR